MTNIVKPIQQYVLDCDKNQLELFFEVKSKQSGTVTTFKVTDDNTGYNDFTLHSGWNIEQNLNKPDKLEFGVTIRRSFTSLKLNSYDQVTVYSKHVNSNRIENIMFKGVIEEEIPSKENSNKVFDDYNYTAYSNSKRLEEMIVTRTWKGKSIKEIIDDTFKEWLVGSSKNGFSMPTFDEDSLWTSKPATVNKFSHEESISRLLEILVVDNQGLWYENNGKVHIERKPVIKHNSKIDLLEDDLKYQRSPITVEHKTDKYANQVKFKCKDMKGNQRTITNVGVPDKDCKIIVPYDIHKGSSSSLTFLGENYTFVQTIDKGTKDKPSTVKQFTVSATQGTPGYSTIQLYDGSDDCSKASPTTAGANKGGVDASKKTTLAPSTTGNDLLVPAITTTQFSEKTLDPNIADKNLVDTHFEYVYEDDAENSKNYQAQQDATETVPAKSRTFASPLNMLFSAKVKDTRLPKNNVTKFKETWNFIIDEEKKKLDDEKAKGNPVDEILYQIVSHHFNFDGVNTLFNHFPYSFEDGKQTIYIPLPNAPRQLLHQVYDRTGVLRFNPEYTIAHWIYRLMIYKKWYWIMFYGGNMGQSNTVVKDIITDIKYASATYTSNTEKVKKILDHESYRANLEYLYQNTKNGVAGFHVSDIVNAKVTTLFYTGHLASDPNSIDRHSKDGFKIRNGKLSYIFSFINNENLTPDEKLKYIDRIMKDKDDTARNKTLQEMSEHITKQAIVKVQQHQQQANLTSGLSFYENVNRVIVLDDVGEQARLHSALDTGWVVSKDITNHRITEYADAVNYCKEYMKESTISDKTAELELYRGDLHTEITNPLFKPWSINIGGLKYVTSDSYVCKTNGDKDPVGEEYLPGAQLVNHEATEFLCHYRKMTYGRKSTIPPNANIDINWKNPMDYSQGMSYKNLSFEYEFDDGFKSLWEDYYIRDKVKYVNDDTDEENVTEDGGLSDSRIEKVYDIVAEDVTIDGNAYANKPANGSTVDVRNVDANPLMTGGR